MKLIYSIPFIEKGVSFYDRFMSKIQVIEVYAY